MNSMRALTLAAAIALAALLGSASEAGAVTLVNGSFEMGPEASNGYFVDMGVGNTSIPGWSIDTGTIDYITHYWPGSDGERSIDLAGAGPGSISQTFATDIGQHYVVSFDLAGNPDGSPIVKTLSVGVNGAAVQNYTASIAGVTSYANLGWTRKTYNFVATSGSSTLTFTDTAPTSPYGPALDNVAVAAAAGVPEPAAWTMMVIGFGGLGALLRRRARRALPA
jgi:choice-of-anchor C domain-containing protein